MSVVIVRSQAKEESVADVAAAVERLFAAIRRAQPEGIRYAPLRLPDGVTYVALLQLDDGMENPGRAPGAPGASGGGSRAGAPSRRAPSRQRWSARTGSSTDRSGHAAACSLRAAAPVDPWWEQTAESWGRRSHRELPPGLSISVAAVRLRRDCGRRQGASAPGDGIISCPRYPFEAEAGTSERRANALARDEGELSASTGSVLVALSPSSMSSTARSSSCSLLGRTSNRRPRRRV